MKKLWQKNQISLNPLIEKYTVGEDYLLDREIFKYDIQGTAAHAMGLRKINILTPAECDCILKSLKKLADESERIEIKPEEEDCHTVIENYLVGKCGAAGKKIHTGRSRNDQILTATRLYLKDSLRILGQKTIKLARTFLEKTKKYQHLPMPGYSHMQQAMLITVGHWLANFTEALIDDAKVIRSIIKLIDKSPLGSAAGFGVSFPLPRLFTAQKMGFKEVQINSLYCQNSRGKFESLALECLAQIMLTLSRFASDLLLFTTREFNFFKVDESLVTGSSIMPQKKNLDGLEMLRANAEIVISNQNGIKNLIKSLPSGFQRDLQLTKKYLIESVRIATDSIDAANLYLQGIEPNAEVIEKMIKPDIYLADKANMLVTQGVPFREAYMKAWEEKDTQDKKCEAKSNWQTKISLGGPGNLQLSAYGKEIKSLQKSFFR